MKISRLQQWLNALRSGEYQQGYGYLCKNGLYCCLGVLCELLSKERIIRRIKDYEFNSDRYIQ